MMTRKGKVKLMTRDRRIRRSQITTRMETVTGVCPCTAIYLGILLGVGRSQME